MELLGIRVEQPAGTPLLLLRETSGQGRILPIFIGQNEAAAIAYAVEGMVTPRPMTHDLLKTVLEDLGAKLEKIVVTELREHTFYAELHLKIGEEVKVVSSRPSDAVALAVRTRSTIFASAEVLDAAGQAPPPEDDAEPEADSEELVEEFREFIQNVRPDDFAS
jgi:uncharacterized protein